MRNTLDRLLARIDDTAFAIAGRSPLQQCAGVLLFAAAMFALAVCSRTLRVTDAVR